MRRLFDYQSVSRQERSHILAAMLFGSVLSTLLIMRFVLSLGVVEGDSMLPSLRDGERYIINRWIYRVHEPQPGDIVAIHTPGDGAHTVKRIIALPGDVVQIRDGWVHVNGRRLAEPYLNDPGTTEGKGWGARAFKIPDGLFVVLGDNRAISADSRLFGGVPRAQLIGKVSLQFGN